MATGSTGTVSGIASLLGTYNAPVGTGTSNSKFGVVSEVALKIGSGVSDPTTLGLATVQDAAAYTPNLFVFGGSLPASTPSAGILVQLLSMPKNMAQVAFLLAKYTSGAYVSPVAVTGDCSIFLVKELPNQNNKVSYVEEYVGKVNLATNSNASGVYGGFGGFPLIASNGPQFANSIVVAEDVSLDPGMRVTGQNAALTNGNAFLQFDAKGAIAVRFVFDNASTSGQVFAQGLLSQV